VEGGVRLRLGASWRAGGPVAAEIRQPLRRALILLWAKDDYTIKDTTKDLNSYAHNTHGGAQYPSARFWGD